MYAVRSLIMPMLISKLLSEFFIRYEQEVTQNVKTCILVYLAIVCFSLSTFNPIQARLFLPFKGSRGVFRDPPLLSQEPVKIAK